MVLPGGGVYNMYSPSLHFIKTSVLEIIALCIWNPFLDQRSVSLEMNERDSFLANLLHVPVTLTLIFQSAIHLEEPTPV